jgi:RNA polymerase-binding transcription factor DksA
MQRSMRTHLESELSMLRERLVRVDRRKANATRDDIQNLDEVAEQHQDDEVLDGLETRTREHVAAIERTIERIDAGTWATCAHCGARIDRARLRAIATTDRCASCARAESLQPKEQP